jgi:hypothetical protein
LYISLPCAAIVAIEEVINHEHNGENSGLSS